MTEEEQRRLKAARARQNAELAEHQNRGNRLVAEDEIAELKAENSRLKGHIKAQDQRIIGQRNEINERLSQIRQFEAYIRGREVQLGGRCVAYQISKLQEELQLINDQLHKSETAGFKWLTHFKRIAIDYHLDSHQGTSFSECQTCYCKYNKRLLGEAETRKSTQELRESKALRDS